MTLSVCKSRKQQRGGNAACHQHRRPWCTRRFNEAAALLLLVLCTCFAAPVKAQGTINIALQQQFSFTGCTTGGGVGGIACGAPMLGCLLYLYQTGTVATPQLAYQDTGLTLPLPWPVPCDGNARLPMFYLANGTIHPRLTDNQGVVQFDYPSMLVIGPSSGGGGGGGVDPTTILATGDFKWRPTAEVLPGFVRANGLTIGNSGSGGTERANADTQALFIYLWNNFPLLTVSGGRGVSGLADYNANKTIATPDMRDRSPYGTDTMGNVARNGLGAQVPFTQGNATTPASFGGQSVHTLLLVEAPTGQFTLNDPGHVHPPDAGSAYVMQFGVANVAGGGTFGFNGAGTTGSAFTGITLTDHGGNGAHNVMNPFMLGTWYMKE